MVWYEQYNCIKYFKSRETETETSEWVKKNSERKTKFCVLLWIFLDQMQ